MKTFDVTVYVSEDYTLEANNEDEAMDLAVKRFTNEYKRGCIDVQVESILELEEGE